MKKTFSFLAVLCMAVTANATILRVNNNTGSSAPYATVEEALEAAAEGDTIMVDASSQTYGSVTIDKRVVLLGPGYYLATNGIIAEGAESALFTKLDIAAEGTVVKGIETKFANSTNMTIAAPKVVVNRCLIGGYFQLRNASNSIIHQNRIIGGLEAYGSSYEESYIQVTNNFVGKRISCLSNSYIAYNTICTNFYGCKNCTINNNWGSGDFFKDSSSAGGNSYNNNYVSDEYKACNNHAYSDGYLAAIEVDETLRSTYGAFAGDDPYVISGVPAGPVVQELVVPTTIEKGSKLQVTIKVGIQQ